MWRGFEFTIYGPYFLSLLLYSLLLDSVTLLMIGYVGGFKILGVVAKTFWGGGVGRGRF